MNLTVSIDGIGQSNRAFRLFDESIRDFSGLWPEVQGYWLRANREHFASLGARGGNRWAPLSEKYAQWKERRYPGRPLMVLTGRLLESLTIQNDRDQVYEATPTTLTMGTIVPYARYHQRGTKRLPVRRVLQPTSRDLDTIVSRMYRYSERLAREAGFSTTGRARNTPGAF